MQPVLVTAEESTRDQAAAAAALAARGIERGARVAIVGHSTPEYLAVTLGALRTGIVPVLLNATLTPAELGPLLADCDPALVLVDHELQALVEEGRQGGTAAELAPWPLARPMLYTSGTTGVPKGVWSGVLEERAAEALLLEERELWGFTGDDVHVVLSPLHHSAPIRFATGTLLAGGAIAMPGPFEPAALVDALRTHRPTNAFMVPAHLQRLFAWADANDVSLPFSSFRVVAHAGSACPESLKRRALDAFPAGVLWEFYGSTEGQFTSCAPDEWLARPGTVGRARPGRTLSTDDDGTIWCRVPDHARFEYWRAPDKTAAAWRGDAFSVFDLGTLDDDGYLFLDGRRDDLIISGGMNVYPLEVERVLLAAPGVRDVVVFPLDDERWGQEVCALVVGDASDAQVQAWARDRLAPYKRPKLLVRLDAVPVNSMGKVRRSQLAETLGLTSAG